MLESTHDERRQFPRTPYRRAVHVRLAEWESLWVWGHDISSGGIRVSLPSQVSAGERLTVGLTLPNELQIALEAEVSHVSEESSDGACVAGLRWLESGSPDAEVLQLLIDELLGVRRH